MSGVRLSSLSVLAALGGALLSAPAHASTVKELIAVKTDGTLVRASAEVTYNAGWFRKNGRCWGCGSWIPASLASSVSAPVETGTGWEDVETLVADNLGDLYAVDQNGDLLYYDQPLERMGVEPALSPADLSAIGVGWSGERLAATSNGTLFLEAASDLYAYRYAGGWTAGSGADVGDGWDVFGSLTGHAFAVYGIAADGGLHRYTYDTDAAGGFASWTGGGLIGTDWDAFAHVAAGNRGEIYAIDADGNLYWYRFEADTGTWNEFSGTIIDTGWTDVAHFTVGRQETCTYHAYVSAYCYWYVCYDEQPAYYECGLEDGPGWVEYE